MSTASLAVKINSADAPLQASFNNWHLIKKTKCRNGITPRYTRSEFQRHERFLYNSEHLPVRSLRTGSRFPDPCYCFHQPHTSMTPRLSLVTVSKEGKCTLESRICMSFIDGMILSGPIELLPYQASHVIWLHRRLVVCTFFRYTSTPRTAFPS